MDEAYRDGSYEPSLTEIRPNLDVLTRFAVFSHSGTMKSTLRNACKTILTNDKGHHQRKPRLPMEQDHLDGSNEPSLTVTTPKLVEISSFQKRSRSFLKRWQSF